MVIYALIVLLLASLSLTEGRSKTVCNAVLKDDATYAKGYFIQIGYSLVPTASASLFTSSWRDPDTVITELPEFQALSSSDRRKTAEYLYWALLTACRENSLGCKLCDLPYIAIALAGSGDAKCDFICDLDQTEENLKYAPTKKAFQVLVHAGAILKNTANTYTKFKKVVKRGIQFSETVKSSMKVDNPLAYKAGAKIIVVVAALLKKWSVDPATKDKLDELAPSPEGSSGCFSASSTVNVIRDSNKVTKMQLKDIQIGDLVESINEVTGQRVFSNVYYIEHLAEKQMSQLLRVYYESNDGKNSLALSPRHLVYVSKTKDSVPLTEPIKAEDVEIGDYVWIYKSNALEAKKVIEIIPFVGEVRHPLTQNHHIIVDSVHASVHTLNENLYRALTAPLRFTYWLNPEWNESLVVRKLVRFVEAIKEPIFNPNLTQFFSQLSLATRSEL